MDCVTCKDFCASQYKIFLQICTTMWETVFIFQAADYSFPIFGVLILNFAFTSKPLQLRSSRLQDKLSTVFFYVCVPLRPRCISMAIPLNINQPKTCFHWISENLIISFFPSFTSVLQTCKNSETFNRVNFNFRCFRFSHNLQEV